jgi:transposase-like protein
MQMAVERLNQCENIVALSQELGVSRRLLYTWCDRLDPVERREGPPANARESTLRKEVSQLKRLLAEKVLDLVFFKGALHTFEARRLRTGTSGAQASTPTSGT